MDEDTGSDTLTSSAITSARRRIRPWLLLMCPSYLSMSRSQLRRFAILLDELLESAVEGRLI